MEQQNFRKEKEREEKRKEGKKNEKSLDTRACNAAVNERKGDVREERRGRRDGREEEGSERWFRGRDVPGLPQTRWNITTPIPVTVGPSTRSNYSLNLFTPS